jgi:hypothetical protein
VARVLAAIESTPAQPWGWLERWARLGIAAAVVMMLGVLMLSRATAAPATGDDVVLASVDSTRRATTAFLLAEAPPDPGLLFADVVGVER